MSRTDAASESTRDRFEKWLQCQDLETDRYPDDFAYTAQRGHYRDCRVQLAWEAWQEADARDRRERAMMRLLRRWLVTGHNYTPDEDVNAQVYRFMGRGEAYFVPECAVEAAIQEEAERMV